MVFENKEGFKNKEDVERTATERIQKYKDEGKELNTVGVFYGLFGKEVLYHENAIYHLLEKGKTRAFVLKALFKSASEISIKDKTLEKEKTICDPDENNKKRRIDIYFEIKRDGKDSIPVILELKTDTDNHDNQLSAYKNYFEKKRLSPQLFYITPDGRRPSAEGEKDKKILEKYERRSYLSLVKELVEKLPCLSDVNTDMVIKDYCETVVALSNQNIEFRDVYQKQILNYYSLFQAIGDLCSIKKTRILIEYQPHILEGEQDVTYDVLFNAFKIIEGIKGQQQGIEYIKITLLVEKEKKGCLGIERKWMRYGEDGEIRSSMYYGIREDDAQNKDRYVNLIQRWNELGRTLNATVNEKTVTRKKKQKTVRKVDDAWYVVQFLTDWVMPFCDEDEVYKGRNDAQSWAKWIEEDFDLIDE